METAHRLPRFFVGWWICATALGLLIVPLVALVDAAFVTNGRPSAPLLWLSDIAGSTTWSALPFLGVAQAIALRGTRFEVRSGRWAFLTTAGWIVGIPFGFVVGIAVFLGVVGGLVFVGAGLWWLIPAVADFPEAGIAPLAFTVVAICGGSGGAVLGLSVGACQGFELARRDASAYSSWLTLSALGWMPYGAALGMAMTYFSLVGLHEEPAPAWLVALATIGLMLAFASPGLVTGIALKRIVEAQPAPPEDVRATPEVPSASGPVQ